MYYVQKEIEISAAHQLKLPYKSKCEVSHGHNWIIIIYMKADELDENGMVMDFTYIKKKIKERLDHQDLNKILPFNPTAENIAKWIADELGPKCYMVSVKESQGNIAIYEVDEHESK